MGARNSGNLALEAFGPVKKKLRRAMRAIVAGEVSGTVGWVAIHARDLNESITDISFSNMDWKVEGGRFQVDDCLCC